MKHMRTLTSILLVGLLISCVPTTSNEPVTYNTPTVVQQLDKSKCVTEEQYGPYLAAQNIGGKTFSIKGKNLAAFIYNFNRLPPVSDLNITGVIVSVHPDKSMVKISILVDGCMKHENAVAPQTMQELVTPPKGA